LASGLVTFWFHFPGEWIILAVLGGAALLLIHRDIKSVKRWWVTFFILGVCLFLYGMWHPVQYASGEPQLVKTFIGGNLVSSEVGVSGPTLNYLLLIGMGLVLFSLLFLGLVRPVQKRST
jgi:hypothetical protein